MRVKKKDLSSTFYISLGRRSCLLIWLLLMLIPSLALAKPTPYPPAYVDPTLDGAFTDADEYKTAYSFLNNQGDGTFYTQHRSNWTPPGGTVSYPGITLFTMHDIWGYTSQDNADYNMFQGTWAGQTSTIWVFANADELDDSSWIGNSGLGYATIDDRGFLARLGDGLDPANPDAHWLPGMPVPGDPAWDWDKYYGLSAAAGFNNSAFSEGYDIDPTHAAENEVYEFAFYGAGIPGGCSGPGICEPVFARVLDPKAGDPSQVLLNKADIEAHAVPDPASLTLALIGLSYTSWWLRRRKTLR